MASGFAHDKVSNTPLSVQWTILAILISLFAAAVIYDDWLWEWDALAYDYIVRLDRTAAPDDVILVAIDETSLEMLGRWPWRRHVHAELIRILTESKSAVVVFDVLFTEPDVISPESDVALASAIKKAGNVILPIANVERYAGGPLMELLPMPPLVEGAAALGHTDLPLDEDGIARRIFLRGGLGDPHWSSLGLAALEQLTLDPLSEIIAERHDENEKNSPLKWVRDYGVGIPFSGPPGHFHHVSFVDALTRKVPPSTFKDKIVLVGATAAGLGDVLPTPVSGMSRPMPGVEVIANVLDGLRSHRTIAVLPDIVQIPLTVGVILFVFFLFPRMKPQTTLVSTLVFMIALSIVSFLLLSKLRVWFPPTMAVLGILAAYIFWSWNRLMRTLVFLNQEVRYLGAEPNLLEANEEISLTAALPYLTTLLPLSGAVLVSETGQTLDQFGDPIGPPHSPPKDGEWTRRGLNLWKDVGTDTNPVYLGLKWKDQSPLTPREVALLDRLADRLLPKKTGAIQGPVEFLQAKIWEVQKATARIQNLRRLIEESLSQLPSGMLLMDDLGVVRLSNSQAAQLLTSDAKSELTGYSIEDLIECLNFPREDDFSIALKNLYRSNESQTLNATTRDNRQLLLDIASFTDETEAHMDGIIMNIADVTLIKNAESRRREMMGFLSHDLRAPLASILGITHLTRLKKKALDVESAERIEQHARKTLELADNFMHLSRNEDEDRVVMEVLDLGKLVELAVSEVAPQATGKSLALETILDDGNHLVKGNESLLERLFINLLTNAIKYSPNGSKILVNVFEGEDRNVVAQVQDNGRGIPQEQIPRLFDRYETFKRGEQATGTGLGLAFVKQVADQHGVPIEVTSETAKGTTFELTFQASVPEQESPPEQALVDLSAQTGG